MRSGKILLHLHHGSAWADGALICAVAVVAAAAPRARDRPPLTVGGASGGALRSFAEVTSTLSISAGLGEGKKRGAQRAS